MGVHRLQSNQSGGAHSVLPVRKTPMSDDAARALSLRYKIMPVLEGQGPDVQGAVLADLLSLWLAGQIVLDDKGEIDRVQTLKMREEMLTLHIEHVRLMMPSSEAEVLHKLKTAGNA
jgi:hypothetical protein